MSAALPLKGKNRWLTNLGTLAVALGLAVASAYVAVTITLPEGSRVSFFVVLIAVSLGFNFLGDTIEQRRLQTLKRVGDGALPSTPEHLREAAREVMGLPQVSFWLSFSLLSVGPLVVCGVWSLVAEVPTAILAQVAFVGFTVAPITATLVFLVSVPRTRTVLRELVQAGLPVLALYEGVPAPFVLRRRLVAFAAIAVATPLLLVGDLALTRLRALLQLMVTAPDEATIEAIAASQRADGLIPVVGLVLLVVLVVSLSAWLSGSILGDPFKELAAETERLAKGHHGEPRFIPAEFETFAAAGALASMEAQLVELLGRLGHGAGALLESTGALSGVRVTTAAAQNLGTASSTTVELARSARDIADNAQRVSELARDTLEAAKGGRDGADGFMAAMVQVREGNQAIADSVVRLNKRVQQVGRIIEFINGIADKSDLLALNAELEGNKAGEVGRGFSLVAAEMRRLAESVMQSTREIGGLIDEIRDATNAAVMATEAGVKATDAGAGLAQKVSEGLSRIVDYANQSADAMQSISHATSQQQTGTDQLVGAMAEIIQSRKASDEAAQEMLGAHARLSALAKHLEETLARTEVRP